MRRAFQLLSISLLVLSACESREPVDWQGYVEYELTYVSLPTDGEITEMNVKRGDVVKTGDPLFALDDLAEQHARDQAAAELAKAEAEFADLQKGERPEELEIIQAQLDEAKASLALSEPRLVRRKKMVTGNIIGEEELDEAQSAILSDRGRIEQYSARLAAAQLPARADQIAAAERNIAARRAALEVAEWDLGERNAEAPSDGRVEDVLYRLGETAAANDPVVALLTPENTKLRFFVPEPVLGSIKIGQKVEVRCDGCAGGLTATIDFIAREAEYTPPVIYSIGRRDKLMFLVEAVPDDLSQPWHAGQPVDIRPAAAGTTK